ncbi:TIGR02234 family membrane protein [Corynebacterium choanae]|uniref:Tryptophan-associated transmembrane protein n=1 Tax=Corynebacterium choanae TaxID=1862358 RepID=A0A3G6J4Q3_9CORY|nr:TIGR02234 family membrane protein [Corynebacterium choanae]AZA13007.1 Tryptophan-associated transmembrane protein [Corynebacterium choanae]
MQASSSSSSRHRLGIVMLAVGALLLWIASRLPWVTVTAFDDKAGDVTRVLSGGAWATELTGVALGLTAACVALLVVRPAAKRVVALFSAILAGWISWRPMSMLVAGADPQRAKDLLVHGLATQKTTDPQLLNAWADLQTVETHQLGPVVALLGAAAALVGAVVCSRQPRTPAVVTDRFEQRSAEQTVLDDLAQAPDSPRLMWDALDHDVDPTTVHTSDEQSNTAPRNP